MIACRYIRFIGLSWFGILLLVACNSGDMGPSKEPAEPAQSERQGEIQAEDVLGRGAGDYFGYAVAVSGHHALIGQPHDETRGTQAGAAYIFERQGDAWKEVSKLVPDEITADDMFGVTVALDDDIAAVGAPGADDGQGAVYVFERHDREWRQVQRLKTSQAQHHDGFASAVALAGNYLFAGARGDGDAGEQAGAVYVFERQNGLWSVSEVQKLLAYSTGAGDQFGISVAMADVSALIGASAHDGTGAAYIFELQDGVWTESTQLQASGGEPGDHFGRVVATSGDIAVVGAPHDGLTGAVYLFERQPGGWTSTSAEPLTLGDQAVGVQFGAAVAISDRVILVGAYDDAERHDTSGAVYLFTSRPGEAWQKRHQFPQADEPRSPHFGYAVALNGPYILIGAPAILTRANGHVYPYKNVLADTMLDTVSSDMPSPPANASLVAEDISSETLEPEANRAPRITSTPMTHAEVAHVTPEITVTDPHLSQQTITLNGLPFTPGTAITAAGSYELTVEAIDAAGNTSRTTVRFSIDPTDLPYPTE